MEGRAEYFISFWVKLEMRDAVREEALSKPLPELSFGYRFCKRGFDIVSSFLGIIVLSPVFIAVAISVRATSPGPVLFRQARYGKNLVPFTLYKFRSMTVDTPPDVPTRIMKENGSCLTSIGGFLRRNSLDELPQLFNILKGDMSVVGPRPIFLKEIDRIEARGEAGVNDIRPGLTGWAQVNGRDSVSMEEQVRLDRAYRDRMSVKMDAVIFFKTISVVLRKDGYEGTVTEAESSPSFLLEHRED